MHHRHRQPVLCVSLVRVLVQVVSIHLQCPTRKPDGVCAVGMTCSTESLLIESLSQSLFELVSRRYLSDLRQFCASSLRICLLPLYLRGSC